MIHAADLCSLELQNALLTEDHPIFRAGLLREWVLGGY
jgi:hypothetical protein